MNPYAVEKVARSLLAGDATISFLAAMFVFLTPTDGDHVSAEGLDVHGYHRQDEQCGRRRQCIDKLSVQ